MQFMQSTFIYIHNIHNIYIYIYIDRQIDRYRQIDRQVDRQIDIDRQIDRQIHIYTINLIKPSLFQSSNDTGCPVGLKHPMKRIFEPEEDSNY